MYSETSFIRTPLRLLLGKPYYKTTLYELYNPEIVYLAYFNGNAIVRIKGGALYMDHYKDMTSDDRETLLGILPKAKKYVSTVFVSRH